jgi:uncharacterized protein
MKTFVDTGGWLAVVVQTDQYHEVGVLHYEVLINRRERLFTSDYVLDETVTRIRYDASHSTAVAFLDLIGAAKRSGSLHILHVVAVTLDEVALSFPTSGAGARTPCLCCTSGK